ncbi:DMT family transporter [Thiomicrorhabdus sp.]|uniref:DMT family transporter n=1 Tax=Thiomicrorhabdus sp. TaxID=2039724 RepID=UPI003563BD54
MPLTNTPLSKTILFTGLALIAFAANSVLNRLALDNQAIDPAGFTMIRLFSGALVLLTIVSFTTQTDKNVSKGSWTAGLMLFLYAICFSYAYLTLETGTGALILFGAVQISIILITLFSGGRLLISEWIGMAIAFSGFVALVLPGVSAPSPEGFVLMAVSGIAWGIYTLIGRGSQNPLTDTAYNFIRTLPMVVLLAVLTLNTQHYTYEGILLAVLSGGIASGIGYTLWYIALGGLSSTQAAVVQLLVPVLAVFGGVLFVSEAITLRLVLSTILILGGILIVVLGKYFFDRLNSKQRG